MALSDEDWDEYASRHGVTPAGVSLAADGTVQIEDPEIAAWVRSLQARGE